MSTFKVARGSTASRVFAVTLLAATVVMATMPSWAEGGTQRKMVELFTLISMAQMWNLLAGFAGVVSVGQQAFIGLGAYSMVALVNVHGQNVYAAIPMSAVLTAIFSIPIALIAFRLRGSYFAIGTWVLADVVSLIMQQQNSLGAGNGISIKVSGDALERLKIIYWLALGLAIGAIVLTYAVLRSRLGLQMQAIRDNEGGAKGLGANVYRTRFVAWVIAAFWIGLTGAVFYLANLRVQPKDSFSVVNWTAPIVVIVVIGGIGTIEGPIIGALLYYFLRDYFKDYETWYLIGSGVAAILAALYMQPGIWGYVRRRWGIDLFPIRRRLVRAEE
ncbi:MAG: branched-chain amino acid ABC transporter permease [Ilumatobacteraceae bacterium]|jgi:branched-chain amino acid transport system permease protein